MSQVNSTFWRLFYLLGELYCDEHQQRRKGILSVIKGAIMKDKNPLLHHQMHQRQHSDMHTITPATAAAGRSVVKVFGPWPLLPGHDAGFPSI